MNLVKNRSRLVSFRLSPDELENLRVACLMRGARNVSEFARGAVLECVNPRPQAEMQLLDRFSALELRLTELQTLAQQHQEVLRALARAVAHRDEKAQREDRAREEHAREDRARDGKSQGKGA